MQNISRRNDIILKTSEVSKELVLLKNNSDQEMKAKKKIEELLSRTAEGENQ